MIVFKNKGEIDPIAITTFGISVKNESAIGYFGTGLKMAISVILREGGEITIWSGLTEYRFTTKNVIVKDKEFSVICMNDQPLGFTTDNAKNWKMWQAVREILCNCIDENGEHDYDSEVIPEEGVTHVVVNDKSFEKEYNNRSDFILSKTNPIFNNSEIDVYLGSSHGLFYKGVKVYDSDKPFKYTYNLRNNISLTEDRTMASAWYDTNYTLCRLILESENEDFVTGIMSVEENYAEYKLEYSSGEPSSPFKEKLSALKGKIDHKAPPNLLKKYKPNIKDELKSVSGNLLNSRQEKMIKKSVEMLSNVGVFSDIYPVKVVDSLGDGILGLADQDSKIIYLAERVFDLGTKYLAGTLYEEYIHIQYGVRDETRGFQDVVIQHLMSAIEQIKDDVF